MAGLAQGKLQTKRASLSLALEGSVGPHQRLVLKRLLEHIEFLEGEIDAVSQEIEARMRLFRAGLRQARADPWHRQTQRATDPGRDRS